MAQKRKDTAHKKTAHRPVKKGLHSTGKKTSLFEQLADRKNRPLHVAGLGTIMVLLQGIFALVGFLLIVGAALAYATRAFKASNR